MKLLDAVRLTELLLAATEKAQAEGKTEIDLTAALAHADDDARADLEDAIKNASQ